MEPHQLSKVDARRIALRAQLLDEPRPTDLLEVVRHLALVQVNPTRPIAPSADLLLWSRLGSSYSPDELTKLVDDGSLIEYKMTVRPSEYISLIRADMADWPGRGQLPEWQYDNADWVRANDACRRDILERLRQDGPLPARELPDTCAVPWKSSGWTNHKNVLRLLEFMVYRGEVATVGREGGERMWDLAERVYPDDPIVPSEEAKRIRDEQRLRSLGIARAKGPVCGVEPSDAGDAGEPAVVEGVRGQWRVDPTLLDEPFTGRAALLSPFDRVISDRKRMLDLFEFDYQLEMFKPAAHRRWGYYALPVLYGDRLVGKLDATANHDAGTLDIHALYEDAPFTKRMRSAVDEEIDDLAHWLDLRT
ncbi:MAG: crosslink repair DNA glycosylase YcaQ family protein [Nocardioidaceae bacterium]